MKFLKTIFMFICFLFVFCGSSLAASISDEPIDNFETMDAWYQSLGSPWSDLQATEVDQFNKSGLDEVLAILNQEICDHYGFPTGYDHYTKTIYLSDSRDELELNTYVLKTRGMITYGPIHGDYEDGHYRYLGYSRLGAKVTNRMFPIETTRFDFLQMKKDGWLIQDPLRDDGKAKLEKITSWKNPSARAWTTYKACQGDALFATIPSKT